MGRSRTVDKAKDISVLFVYSKSNLRFGEMKYI